MQQIKYKDKWNGDEAVRVHIWVCLFSSMLPFIESSLSLSHHWLPSGGGCWSKELWLAAGHTGEHVVRQWRRAVACASQWGHVERRRIKGELNLSSHHQPTGWKPEPDLKKKKQNKHGFTLHLHLLKCVPVQTTWETGLSGPGVPLIVSLLLIPPLPR